MTPAALLQAVLTYGPSIIPLAQKLTANIRDRKTEVTKEDFDELNRLAMLSSNSIYSSLGISPPPAK